jgi:Mg-chelatase subunit ChlD
MYSHPQKTEFNLLFLLQVSHERRRKTVDLLFLLDATSSMRNLMSRAKDKILTIAEKIQDNEKFELRVGCICYR